MRNLTRLGPVTARCAAREVAYDNSSGNKVRFHEHLEQLGVPHTFFLVEGVGHTTLPLLEGLGGDRWGFYPRP